MNNCPSNKEILHFVHMLLEVAQQSRQRRMLVLSGAAQWCYDIASEMVPLFDNQHCLWVSNHAHVSVNSVIPSQAVSVLGGEAHCVIYDAHSGFDADAFGAVSGLVVGGGLFVLLAPDLNHWARLPDAEAKRFLAEQDREGDSGFIRRLCSILNRSAGVYLLNEQGALPSIESMPISVDSETASPPYATHDQQLAVEAIKRTATLDQVMPTVLVSDRGRGKSAALGIAAAQLLQAGVKKIIVTAPRKGAVDAVFEHAMRVLPDAECIKNKITYQQNTLEFVAPDELCLHSHPADMVMVDEAAAIPTPMLDLILEKYKRTVFATTVHGYEGSGRGFALRFNQVLDQKTPGWQSVRMNMPIRWAQDDPVEQFVFDALMLSASIAAEEQLSSLLLQNAVVTCVDRQALLDDEYLLSQVFGLLVLAHYRTRPNDLRQMLDSRSVQVYVLQCDEVVIGTALVAEEGVLSPALAEAVYKGNRRIRGNIVPQTLAAYVGMPEAATKRFARIMRIAIHPQLQGRGYGTRLLSTIAETCAIQGYDFAGVSYGATPQLFKFWQRLGFDVVRIGMTRDQSSGVHSVVMLKCLSDADQSILSGAVERFNTRLPYLLKDQLLDLDSALLAALFNDQEITRCDEFTAAELKDLNTFAYDNLGIETVVVQLHCLADRLCAGQFPVALSHQERVLLLEKFSAHNSWADVCESAGLTGKREALKLLRRIVAKFIEAAHN